MMNKFILLLFPILLPLSRIFAQADVASRPVFFTHEFTASVIKIDTVILVEDDYLLNSRMDKDIFKVLKVRIKLISKTKGEFKGFPKEIFINLHRGEHYCLFDFEIGKTYKIFTFISQYSAKSIKKEYRIRHLDIDCYHQPIIQ